MDKGVELVLSIHFRQENIVSEFEVLKSKEFLDLIAFFSSSNQDTTKLGSVLFCWYIKGWIYRWSVAFEKFFPLADFEYSKNDGILLGFVGWFCLCLFTVCFLLLLKWAEILPSFCVCFFPPSICMSWFGLAGESRLLELFCRPE
jgi:hypothetical protein